MLSPLKNYRQQVANGTITENAQQLKVVEILDGIFFQLIQRHRFRRSPFGRLRRRLKPKQSIKGLYVWGGVGIGKTYLIDSFYEQLPVPKMRMHFHEFMLSIHDQLAKLQGHKNPLDLIAKQIANAHLVICFDEFFVSNITDAMLLTELFRGLFKGGVCLVTTSNIAPDDLYKNGLQRERFLPTIEMLTIHTHVFHLHTGQDYRLRHIQQAGVYYTPLNDAAQHNMEKCFKHFSNNQPASTDAIYLFERPIHIIRQADKTVWFEFKDLCGRPRSQKDYLALAKQYRTVLISHVPLIGPRENDLILSFINLIDVLYDTRTRVVISAATTVEGLYTDGAYMAEYERTKSRLIEMQSEDYFAPTSATPALTPL